MNPLIKFIVAAISARTATGGSAVAVILLAREYGADGGLAGALAACLTLPHLLGPFYGRWIEKVAEPRFLLAKMALLFTLCFHLAVVGFDSSQTWLFTLSLLVCGVASSFIMGGLSTQLVTLVGVQQHTRRKAQSWDTITYAIGTTLGPLLIAFLAGQFDVSTAVQTVMTFPIIAAVVIFCFPSNKKVSEKHGESMPNMRKVLDVFKSTPDLRITIFLTASASFSVAALPILAVFLGEVWSGNKENGAFLVTAYGIGNLCGAVFLIVRPLKSEALLLLRNVGVLLFCSLAIIPLSQSMTMGLMNYWLVGVINAIYFAVTLAARSEYSPEKGAAQIYMWVAAAKIGAASIGALMAGNLMDLSLSYAVWITCAVLAVSVILCFWRRETALKSNCEQKV